MRKRIMRVIELTNSKNSLDDLLEIARRETVILRGASHEGFVLAPSDEFDMEVELLRNNKEFMAYLDGLFKQKATIPLEDIEKEFGV